jgi:phage terminase small subunit
MYENLTPKQRKAIETLLTNGDVAEAARAAGVSRNTVYQWFKKPEFTEAMKTSTSQALDDLSRSLLTLGEIAISTLKKAMEDDLTPTSTKVRAADVVFSRLMQFRELVSMEERIRTLERSILDGRKID